MSWKEAIGDGIIGGGSALVVSVCATLLRWVWIGFRADLRLVKDKFRKPVSKHVRNEPSLSRRVK